MTKDEKYTTYELLVENTNTPLQGCHSSQIRERYMVIEVSTSYPDGDKTTVKNCTKLYMKNPNHYSIHALRDYISEYYGEIFLHLIL